MSQKIKIKRSNVTTLPTTAQLSAGELGYTEVSGVKRLFIGNYAGNGVVEIGGDNFALLSSPSFTGTPTAPTATAGTNTTQIATTSFVTNAISNTALTSGNIFVGNASNIATSVTMSGDATISNTGILTVANGAITGAKIANDVALAGNPTTTTQTTSDSSTRIATTAFVQAAVQAAQAGLSAKASALAATTAALPAVTAAGSGIGKTLTATANGVLTVDGVNTWYDVNTDGGSINPDDPVNRSASRVLVKNQTNAADNGIYTVTQKGTASTPFILTRSLDADTGTNLTSGSFIFIDSGTVNANAGFVLSTLDPITIDTTALSFVQFSGAGAISAGNGLIKSGNIISALSDTTTVNTNIANSVNVSANGLAVKIDGSTIDTNGSSQLRVKPGSITTTQISATAGITGTQIANNTITAANLANGTITGAQITLANGNIFMGNASNVATAVTVSGDITISNTGVAAISTNSIINSDLAQAAQRTWKGNNTNATANLSDNAAGALTESTSSVLTITGGANSTLNNVSIQVKQATSSQAGYLSSTDWTTFNNKLTPTLASANIFVGNASNIATAVAISGDATISNTGALTIANNAITAAKIATSIVSSTGGLVGGGGTALAIKPDVTTGATVCPITIGTNGAGVTVDNSSIIHTSGTLSVNIVDGGTF